MNNNDLPPVPPEIPPGHSLLEINKEEMDYLMRYWELNTHGDAVSWATKLLYDLSRLDEAGWRLTMAKCEFDEDTRQITYAPDYRQLSFLMKWLAPTKDGWARLPKAEAIEKITKIERPQT